MQASRLLRNWVVFRPIALAIGLAAISPTLAGCAKERKKVDLAQLQKGEQVRYTYSDVLAVQNMGSSGKDECSILDKTNWKAWAKHLVTVKYADRPFDVEFMSPTGKKIVGIIKGMAPNQINELISRIEQDIKGKSDSISGYLEKDDLKNLKLLCESGKFNRGELFGKSGLLHFLATKSIMGESKVLARAEAVIKEVRPVAADCAAPSIPETNAVKPADVHIQTNGEVTVVGQPLNLNVPKDKIKDLSVSVASEGVFVTGTQARSAEKGWQFTFKVFVGDAILGLKDIVISLKGKVVGIVRNAVNILHAKPVAEQPKADTPKAARPKVEQPKVTVRPKPQGGLIGCSKFAPAIQPAKAAAKECDPNK